ncbi:MAG TPA: flagellar hook-basal body complex protein FliE [Solirubrobacteraceae bacterium]|nr:flagellar hook-basal body complex protein FliE [Solirubrobacteraceae bacterium]
MPIDPISPVAGTEWSIPSISQADGIAGGTGAVSGAAEPTGAAGGFGGMLGDAISSLVQTQQDAAVGAQQLAAGTAQDPTAVVMAVERAQLAMQLAAQVRTKVVEAAQDLFHTQI